MATLQIDSLSCAYKGKRVLNCVSAEFSSGRLTAILGRNGAGKTTLIRCIAGLHDFSGIVRLSDKEKTLDRSHIAYLPQLEKITSSLTAFETILLGLTKQLTWKISEKQLQKVSDVIRELKLEALADTPIKSLSGGQKQLVFLAQAFVSSPKLLLLDEPTSALDIRHQLVVMNTVAKYCKEKDAIALFVIHDLVLASRYSDSILFLHDGKVHAFDRPENVLHSSVIDPIYQIESLIEKNSLGFTTLTPIRPL